MSNILVADESNITVVWYNDEILHVRIFSRVPDEPVISKNVRVKELPLDDIPELFGHCWKVLGHVNNSRYITVSLGIDDENGLDLESINERVDKVSSDAIKYDYPRDHDIRTTSEPASPLKRGKISILPLTSNDGKSGMKDAMNEYFIKKDHRQDGSTIPKFYYNPQTDRLMESDEDDNGEKS